jgi:hypothetical protein
MKAMKFITYVKRDSYAADILGDLCECLMIRREYGACVKSLFAGWELIPDEAQRLRVIEADVKVSYRETRE